MIELPDIDTVGEFRHHKLQELVERFQRKDLAWLLRVITARIAAGGIEGESFKLIPTRHRLSFYVSEITSSQVPPADQLNGLLEFGNRNDLLGYILPQYAADIDPNGVAIPRIIASTLKTRPAKAKKAYGIGSGSPDTTV